MNTPWIVTYLWLPMLAAGLSALAQVAGAERRQMAAHGVSRGYHIENITSPGGATE